MLGTACRTVCGLADLSGGEALALRHDGLLFDRDCNFEKINAFFFVKRRLMLKRIALWLFCLFKIFGSIALI